MIMISIMIFSSHLMSQEEQNGHNIKYTHMHHSVPMELAVFKQRLKSDTS